MRATHDRCIEKLEAVREQMLKAAQQYGLSHPLVLTYSKEIDMIHNHLLKLEDNDR